jgi:hypothetical protein
MKVAWENDRPVVVGKDVRSSWVDMPNQERNRQEWLYPVLRTGQADSAMKTYLETQWVNELQRRKHIIARQRARLAALTQD